ncbi:MAG: ABC transporter permease [Dehalococcoidia bacterium]|nr:ABC transporter permease [Dehalococcoidia bacterium]
MQAYLVRRLVLVIPTLIGLTMVVFLAVRFLPGDLVDAIAGSQGAAATPEIRAQIEEKYHLDKALPEQYLLWVGDILRGDLGESAQKQRPVTEILQQKLPVTIELGVLAIIVSLMVALPLGITSAIRAGTIPDYVARSLGIVFIAVPSFWLALLVITYGFAWFGWVPPLRYAELWEDPASNLRTMWVPALVLGAGLAGTLTRFVRATMLEALRNDYVRTARSKGLGERRIVVGHVLRNALIPIVTVIGLQIPVVIGGSVIIEQIFSLPGMGSELLLSVNQRDYPLIQGMVLVFGFTVVLVNLGVDMSYALIDPRVKYN